MATIDVILRDKIDNLGAEADVVTVKAGFARNYLIPAGKAYEATAGNLCQRENLQRVRADREAKEMEEAHGMAAKIKKMKISLELATGQGGKAFGSITTQDIAKAISQKAKNLKIDRHLIELDKPIKRHGKFDIPIKLHPEVSSRLRLEVVAPPEQEAEPED
ncbi:MAG: 50S ribosomal protein L9 [Verrucomicrobiota bacterium]